MRKRIHNIITLTLIACFIHANSCLYAFQDTLRQAATHIAPGAVEDIKNNIGAKAEVQHMPDIVQLENASVYKRGVEITKDYARVGDIYFLKPDTPELVLGQEKTAGAIIIRLEGLFFYPPDKNDTGNILNHVYGQGSIAIILALQAFKEIIGEAAFNMLEFLDAGAGTGILSIVAAKLGAKHVFAIDDNSEYQQLLAREKEKPSGYGLPREATQLMENNIKLNGVSSLVTRKSQNVSGIRANDYPAENPYVLMLNMRYYGANLPEIILANMRGIIQYAFIAGEPASKVIDYDFMVPVGVELKNIHRINMPGNFSKRLLDKGITITSFGQVFFGGFPALFYELHPGSQASPARTSSSGITAVMDNTVSGAISFNMPYAAAGTLAAWNEHFKESQNLLYKMFAGTAPEARNLAAFILAADKSTDRTDLLRELERAFGVTAVRAPPADSVDYLNNASEIIRISLARSSMDYNIRDFHRESAEIIIKLCRMQDMPISITPDFAVSVGSEERQSAAFDRTHPRAKEPLVNLSQYGIKHAPNTSYVRKSVAEELSKLNETLKKVGWYIDIRDGFRTIRYQQEIIKNYLRKAITESFAGIDVLDTQKESLSGFLLSQDDYLRVGLRDEIKQATDGITDKSERNAKTASVVHDKLGRDIADYILTLGIEVEEGALMGHVQFFSEKLAETFFHFSDPEPLAPHVSGGAFDLEIRDSATGRIIPIKEWQVICDGSKLEQASLEDQKLFAFMKKHPGYKEYEELALAAQGTIDSKWMVSLRNRRIFWHLLKGVKGLFPEGLCEPNRGEFWHFDIGNSAWAYRSGNPAYYGMAIAPNITAELLDLAPDQPDRAVELSLLIDTVELGDNELKYSEKAQVHINAMVERLQLSNRLFANAIDNIRDEIIPFVSKLIYYQEQLADGIAESAIFPKASSGGVIDHGDVDAIWYPKPNEARLIWAVTSASRDKHPDLRDQRLPENVIHKRESARCFNKVKVYRAIKSAA